jgi:uncharacterized protein YbjQ (UPF0145 family)
MTGNEKHLIKSTTGAITGFQRDILITTSDVPSGRAILRTIGLVRGNSVRARHVGLDIMAGLRALVGGEVREYTKLMAESREHSLDRMCEQALQLGANAVVGLRFTTSMVMGGTAELLAYGTAVVVGDPQGD